MRPGNGKGLAHTHVVSFSQSRGYKNNPLNYLSNALCCLMCSSSLVMFLDALGHDFKPFSL